MKDSIYIARGLVLALWWFLTMSMVLIVAVTGEGREDLEEQFEHWRDRATDLLVADETARMAKGDFFKNHTVGGILK